MGAMTQGIMQGLAIRAQREHTEELRKIKDRQDLHSLREMLGSVRDMPAGPVRGISIKKILGPMLKNDPDTLNALSKMNDEEFEAVGEAMTQVMADNPGIGRKGLEAWIRSQPAGLAIPALWKMSQDAKTKQREATLRGSFTPEPSDQATIAQGPQPSAAPPDDFTVRSGPSGMALGMAPDAPPPPPMAMPAPAAPTRPLTPQQQLERLDAAEETLMSQLRKAAPRGGLTEDLARNVTAQREFIQKRRDALLKQIEPEQGDLTEIEGPDGTKIKARVSKRFGGPVEPVARAPYTQQSEVGKLQADLRNLQAIGQSEDSPAGKAIKAQIEQTRTAKDPAQSPMGKMVDDLERAKRLYGPNSIQARTVAEGIEQARKGEGPKAADVNTMRGQFSSLSQSFREVSDAYGRIKSVTKPGEHSQAGDIALLTSFMKMIDPTTGVKEGEFMTASNAGTIPQRIWGTYNRLLSEKNGRLADSIRQDYVNQAKNVYQGHERKHRALEKQYESMAKNQGFNPSDVVVSFIVPEDADDLDKAKREADSAVGAFTDTMKRLREELDARPTPSKRR